MVCSNLIKIHWIYLLANFCVKSFAEDSFCTSMYISNDGFNCSYCSAGSYREGQCVEENGSSICRPCPPGHFQPSCNIAESCQPCRDCKTSDRVVKEPCTPQNDTVCICPDGKYCLRHTNKQDICLKHTSCKHGEVVKVNGTPYEDTVCVKTTTESPPNVKTSTHQTDTTFQHTTSGHQIDTPSQTTEDGTGSCDDHTVGSAFGGFVGGIVVGVLVTIGMCWLCRKKKWCWFSRSCGRNAGGAGNDIDPEGNPLLGRGTSTTNRTSPNPSNNNDNAPHEILSDYVEDSPIANGSDGAPEPQGNEASGGNTNFNANGSDGAQDSQENEASGGNTNSNANGSDGAPEPQENEASGGNTISNANVSGGAQESQGNEASGGNTISNANGSDRAQDTHGSEEMGGNTSSDAAQGSIDNGDPKIHSQESTSNGKFLSTGGKHPK